MRAHALRTLLLVVGGSAAAASPALAEPQTAVPAAALEAVTIVGNRVSAMPGTVQVLDGDVLQASRVFTTSEALRKLPGVNVRDEEGFGLRPNIGIRGLNPTRSTKILLLEDGIPLTYGVYGDNASYYHPPVDRFERIEILKGPQVNLYGPQTIGGVINYITPAPTQALDGELMLAGGNRDYFTARGHLSRLGQRLDYQRKQADGARDNTRLATDDFNYKGLIQTGDHTLIARANYYRENSQVSYTGLTDAEYATYGQRYNPFDNDRFDAYRWGGSLTDLWRMGEARLSTHVYFANFSRDWWRQSSTTTDTQCGTAFRDARIAGAVVDPDACRSLQGRLRDYYNYGLEPRLQLPYAALGAQHQLQAGMRYHAELQRRLQINSTSPALRTGTLAENNRRNAEAFSAFVDDAMQWGRFSLTPGMRVEHVNYERDNRLNGSQGATSLSRGLWSLSSGWQATATTLLYAGAHRGFAPPRTEDILNNNGVAVDVAPEASLNLEAGVRHRPMRGAQLEATAFRNDFSNQIAVGSIAGGNVPLAQGETRYQGLELSGHGEFGRLWRGPHEPFVELAWTWLPVAEQRSALRRVDNGAPVAGSAPGRRLPYAPRHTLTGTLGYRYASRLEARLEAVYVGTQTADFSGTTTPDGTGLVGKLPGATVWNLAANWHLPTAPTLSVFVTAKNLFAHRYIADRTRGILPGTPQLFQGGMEYRF